MAGISIWQLLIIAVIVVLLFGTNKLRSLGSDLGASIKGFKKALNDDDASTASKNTSANDAEFKHLFEQENVQKETEKSQNKDRV